MSALNKRWEVALTEPLQPEDMLSSYQTPDSDPTQKLSASDKEQIAKWMKTSVGLPGYDEALEEINNPVLSESDNAYIKNLNAKANRLPKNNEDFVPPFDIYQFFPNLWARFYTYFKGSKWSNPK